MLNIECVQGTCPCGDLCSNQQVLYFAKEGTLHLAIILFSELYLKLWIYPQFQKRKYAKMQWLRCGKKGYGLQVLDDVSKGGFIIEYVGEVMLEFVMHMSFMFVLLPDFIRLVLTRLYF